VIGFEPAIAEAIQAGAVRLSERLPANERRPPETANSAADERAATMAESDLDVRPASEQAVLDEVRIDDGWRALQEFSHLVGDSGCEDEARSVARITSRLDAWGIRYWGLYSRDGRYRQDPADYVPLLPEFGHAELARGKAPDPVLRTDLARAHNRLDGALMDVVELSGAARARRK
jgi:hypothetical protein